MIPCGGQTSRQRQCIPALWYSLSHGWRPLWDHPMSGSCPRKFHPYWSHKLRIPVGWVTRCGGSEGKQKFTNEVADPVEGELWSLRRCSILEPQSIHIDLSLMQLCKKMYEQSQRTPWCWQSQCHGVPNIWSLNLIPRPEPTWILNWLRWRYRSKLRWQDQSVPWMTSKRPASIDNHHRSIWMQCRHAIINLRGVQQPWVTFEMILI